MVKGGGEVWAGDNGEGEVWGGRHTYICGGE